MKTIQIQISEMRTTMIRDALYRVYNMRSFANIYHGSTEFGVSRFDGFYYPSTGCVASTIVHRIKSYI